VHENISDRTLLATQDVQHKPPASIYELHAYVDLYFASRKNEAHATQNTSIFSIELSGSLLSPISFQKKVKIEGLSFPTVDNVEEHLVHFYYKNYMHAIIPKRPWKHRWINTIKRMQICQIILFHVLKTLVNKISSLSGTYCMFLFFMIPRKWLAHFLEGVKELCRHWMVYLKSGPEITIVPLLLGGCFNADI
jgi:hypothetical protein